MKTNQTVSIIGYERKTGKRIVIARDVQRNVAMNLVMALPHWTDPATGKTYTTYIDN